MVTQLIIATGLAVIISALCSITEAVLYSVSQSQVEIMAHSGKKSGLILKKLKKNIQQPITAILTGLHGRAVFHLQTVTDGVHPFRILRLCVG